MKVALLGCGAIALRAHLPAFQAVTDVDVVAFASRRRESAERARAEWGGGLVVEDWRDALAIGDLDAVVVCTPNALHCEMTLAAIDKGLHVLVEKPMAPTVDEADRMVAAAEAAGVVLMPAQNVRFAPPFAAAARIVASGEIGRTVSFRGAFGHAGPEGWAPDSTWFFDRELAGGGALLDLGVHMIDVIHAVLGERVVEVAAMLDAAGNEMERIAQLTMSTESGAIGTLQASWATRPGPDHQLTVFGTEGTIHLDNRTPLTISRLDRKPEVVELDKTTDGIAAAFARAVAGERPAAVSAADGRAAVAVVCAAYEAARSRATVRVSPATGVAA